MVFSGIVFLYYFLPAVLILYFISPKPFKNTVIFLSSLVFYAWGEPKYVFLMLFTIIVGFLSGIFIEKIPSKKKLWLVSSIIINLALLIFFKYTDFLLSSINTIARTNIPLLNLALPIGISFYTFQTLSYSIDVYRGNAQAQKNIINFGAYVTMFPQLVAGPIVRYSDIAKRLNERKENFKDILSGIELITIGLAKKVLIANNVGMLWTSVSTLPRQSVSVLNAWLGILAYTLQIYFDFSGYSDMAIGLGRIFGFEFLKNFDYPYISKSITEFWRRWHISLGSWFREYVYIPLGGNRAKLSRCIFNIFVVWCLTGLWHGAALNFIIWGLYYGTILILEKYILKDTLSKMNVVSKRIYTILLIMFGWVLFASPDIKSALIYIGTMFGSGKKFADALFLYNLKSYFVAIVVGIFCSTPLASKYIKKLLSKDKFGILYTILIILTLFICTAYLVDSTYNPFLYFRF